MRLAQRLFTGMRLCVTASWLTAPDLAVARPTDGIDTSLLDSLDPSVCEARVFLIFRLSSILTLIDNSVCFSRTTMIPPDCLEDCLPWINVAARAWMGNLEVGRNAALLDGTRREKKGLQEMGDSNTGPLLHVLKNKMSPSNGYASNRCGGGISRDLANAVGGHSATRWSPRFGDKHSRQVAPCFFSALLISAAKKHSSAGDSSFLISFFCTSHASVLAFCFFLPQVQEARAPQQIWRG